MNPKIPASHPQPPGNRLSASRRGALAALGMIAVLSLLQPVRLTAAAPSVSCGVLGRIANTDYQKFQTSSVLASISDGRREDIDGGGQPAGSTISTASATAEFGSLHLSLLTKATADFVFGNFWGHDASASGNTYFSDTIEVNLPGAASGTPVDVVVGFAVDAAVSDVQGGAYLEGTLALRGDPNDGIEIRYQNSGPLTPISSITINRQVDPIKIRYGEEYVIAKLRTGTPYSLDAIIQGSVSANADINPGLDPTARIPFSQGVVDAANTAHVGLKPLVAGATITSGSKAAYAYADLGPVLMGSDRPDGTYAPVAGALTDLGAAEIAVPVGSGPAFFRLAGRIPREIRAVEIREGQVRIRY